jgi:hypothetical protein
MENNKKLEIDRAWRILILTQEYHDSITCLYESLVDKDTKESKRIAISVILEMKNLIKSIDDDTRT